MKLELLPRKEFEIHLDSGEVVKGKYSLWAAKRFCDKKRITLKQLTERLSDDQMTLDDLVENILCAIEHKFREEGKPLKYTDFDVCNWIDLMGPDNFSKLQAHAYSELDGEKKSQEE